MRDEETYSTLGPFAVGVAGRSVRFDVVDEYDGTVSYLLDPEVALALAGLLRAAADGGAA